MRIASQKRSYIKLRKTETPLFVSDGMVLDGYLICPLETTIEEIKAMKREMKAKFPDNPYLQGSE